LILDEKRSKAGISPKPVTLCPCNSRCRKGDKEKASRWSINRKRQNMDIGIYRQPGTVNKE